MLMKTLTTKLAFPLLSRYLRSWLKSLIMLIVSEIISLLCNTIKAQSLIPCGCMGKLSHFVMQDVQTIRHRLRYIVQY